MKTIHLIVALILLMPCCACSQNKELQQFDFLPGTWKIEGKDSYESWVKNKDCLRGQSYKFVNGEKVVSEDIELKIIGGQIIYTPTVFDQNDGKGIPFKLNVHGDDLFSFENSEHDFPKKVQYRRINENELFISVLDENDEGFSYKLIKQVE